MCNSCPHFQEELVPNASGVTRAKIRFAGAAPFDVSVAEQLLDRAILVMLASHVDRYAHAAVVQQHFEGVLWSRG